MVSELIKGIPIALAGAFGDGRHIYINDVKQGLREPCFFVAVLEPSRKILVGSRYRYKNPFCITYIPKDEGNNAEMLETAERMADALEVIKLMNGDCVRGTDLRFEIVDGNLQFFVSYDMDVINYEERTPMEDAAVSVGLVKG